ncbi:MSP (Major sperm protein) domain-containing protein [Ditylenchus destructor]|uniref:MSP (Major sperm protein) domain-containing protein n=1 Tax=Ditylenchus destructor TaxID=166010 RepID=A0AAD4NAA3_9BILA|nr:MSP (Major sperm protein) domain-containing protein [Ditylenchus destructor]
MDEVPPLTADPPLLNVASSGGISVHQLVNSASTRLAFKVRSSNNEHYRLKPVYGIIEPNAATPIEVTRTAGPPKEDKLVIQFMEAPSGIATTAETAQELFKNGNPMAELILPMSAK